MSRRKTIRKRSVSASRQSRAFYPHLLDSGSCLSRRKRVDEAFGRLGILGTSHHSGGEYLDKLKTGGDWRGSCPRNRRPEWAGFSLTGRTIISTRPLATSAAPASDSLSAKAPPIPSCGNTLGFR